ncbi:MAG: type II CAAX endopeptidase family protein [Planctomycetota bacterium]|nr:type II CAAX endopeptidase family protein [Planctomycetota bacterium]
METSPETAPASPHAAPEPPPQPGEPAPPVEIAVEVLPAPEALLQRLGRWLAVNRPALLIACAALWLAVLNEFAHALLNPTPRRGGLPMPRLTDPELHGWALVLMASLVLAGGCAVLGAVAAWFIVPDSRPWLKGIFRPLAVRPLPALRVMDFVAALMVWLCAVRVIGLSLLGVVRMQSGEALALGFILNDTGLLFALVACVYLARRRAAGLHGSNGIWPFWELAPAKPPRSLWRDVAFGLAAYPLSLGAVALATAVNRLFMEVLHWKPDHHMLLDELSKPQQLWVFVVFLVMGTLGAAVFEELFFRGILYNVSRRYLSARVATFSAALIFAAVHMVWSNLLGLVVLALILTWLYDRTGRLVSSMTLHAVNNLVSILLALYSQRPGS